MNNKLQNGIVPGSGAPSEPSLHASDDGVRHHVCASGNQAEVTAHERAEAAPGQSHDEFKDLFDNAPVGFHEMDAAGRLVRINNTELKMLGYTPEELLGQFVWKLSEEEEVSRQAVLAILNGTMPPSQGIERMFRRKDGSSVPVMINDRLLKREDGAIIGMCASVQDITERKKAEENLKLFRALIEHSHDAILFIEPATGRFLDVNQATCRMLGYTRDELLALTVLDVDPAFDRAAFDQLDAQLARTDHSTFESRHRRKDGTIFPVEVSLSRVKLDSEYGVAVVRDITARKRTEAALEQSRAEFKDLFDNAPVGFHEMDAKGRLTRINNTELKMLGYTREELLGQFVWKISGEPESTRRTVLAKLSGKMPPSQGFERMFRRKDGSTFPVLVNDRLLKREDGTIIGMCGGVQDISGRKRAEKALLESQSLYRSFIDQLPCAAFRKDREGRFVMVNPRFCEIKGSKPEDFLGKTAMEVADSQEARQGRGQLQSKYAAVGKDAHERIMRTGTTIETEEEHFGADGRKMFLHVVRTPVFGADGTVIGSQGIEFDITEQILAKEALKQERNLLRTLIDHIPDFIYVRNLSNRFVEANESFARLMEVATPADLIGKNDADFYPPELADEYDRVDRMVLAGHPVINEERALHFPSGQELVVLSSKVPLKNDKGEVVGLIGVGRDITEHKRAEERVADALNFNLTILRTLPVGILVYKASGPCIAANEAAAAILGGTKEQLLQQDFRRLESWKHGGLREAAEAVLAGRVERELEARFTSSFGKQSWLNCRFVPFQYGNEPHLFLIVTDFTERKRAEESLRESEGKYRVLIETTATGFVIVDGNGCVLDANDEYARLAGYEKPEQIVGRSVTEWTAAHDLVRNAEEVKKCFANGFVRGLEIDYVHPDGTVVPIELNATTLKAGDSLRILTLCRDISGRKRAEESQARLATAVEQAAETIVITDTRGTILYANPAFERTTGYTLAEALGQNPRLLKSGKHGPEFYRRMWEVLDRGETWSGHFINQRKDGVFYEEDATISPVRDVTGTVVNYVAVKRDVTREKQLEAQMHQAQKMEAIGQLAGGVAHDFNNILSVIIGYCEMITADLKPDNPLHTYAGEIRHAADHATGLTRQLLVFSRKQKVQPVVLNLDDTVRDLNKILRRLIGEDIEMSVVPGKQVGHIMADPGHVGQVLMNLAVNARDAMPNGGKLTIATSNVTLDEPYTRTHAGVNPGDYVMLSVSDTGAGMTPEVKARLFEALFTTKPAGKGTGLGLATCQTIVQQSGGHIDVESQIGEGATFRIYFPRANEPVESTGGPIRSGPLPRGTETVLLVEDEQSVRNLAANVLEALGYRVLRANNGQEALRLVHDHKGPPIRLVVTDVIMPQMGGKVMADWLKTTDPDLKILFTSGYTDDAIAQQGVLEPGVAFLAKPYTPEALARKVRDVLDNVTDSALPRKQDVPINPSSPGSKGNR
jgi:two-component system, cell cycle sensor histidine kinase and response regulator CckA